VNNEHNCCIALHWLVTNSELSKNQTSKICIDFNILIIIICVICFMCFLVPIYVMQEFTTLF